MQFRNLIPLTLATLLINALAFTQDAQRDPKPDPASQKIKSPIETSDASIKAGLQVYRRYCVSCHGLDGKGQTDIAKDLANKPADLTVGKYRYGKTEGEMFSVIKRGATTGMMAFNGQIPDQRIWHTVNYIKSLAKQKDGETTTAALTEVPENPVPYANASLSKGKQYYTRFCITCHGRDGKGDTEMREFLPTHPSDLSDGDWKYGDRDGDIFLIIKDGTQFDMEAFANRLTDERIWHVVNYLRSMGPKKPAN